MFKVRSGRKTYSIKSSFDEFSLSDWKFYLLFVVNRHADLFEAREKKGSFSPSWYIKDQELYEQTQLHALKQLRTLSGFRFALLHPSVIHELIHEHKVVDFIFETPVMKQNPVFRLKRKFYSILEDFNFLTVKEFAFLDQTFQAFKANNKTEDLDLFCATLFRPEANGIKSGDVRIPFEGHTIEKRAEQMAKIPFVKKRLAMLWFEIKRLELPKRYPLLFSGAASDGAQDWLKTILAMSDGKFGTFTQTESTPILYFLAEMQRAKEEALEAKKQLKQK